MKVSHGIGQYARKPGKALPLRGKPLLFLGDMVGIDIQSYAMDKDDYDITNKIIVPGTPKQLVELLNEETSSDMIGPVSKRDQSQNTVKKRYTMFLASPLIQYILDKDLRARQAFTVLYPVMVSLSLVKIYKRLITFLAGSCTQPGKDVENPINIVDSVGYHHLVVTPNATNHHHKLVLYRQLPNLHPRHDTVTVDPQMTQLVTHVAEVGDNLQLDREDQKYQWEKAMEIKSVREWFGDHITDLLLQLTQSADDDDLPPVDHELAKRKKDENECAIWQAAVNAVVEDIGVKHPFNVTSTQVLALRNLDISGTSKDELGTGLGLFSITPPVCQYITCRKALAEDQIRNHQFDVHGDDDSGMTSAGTKKLINAEGCIPTEWIEIEVQVKQFGPLLGAILGSKYPNVVAHVEGLDQYESVAGELQHNMETNH